MAQTYTLDEAAQRLGITPEVMKRRLKEDWKTVRSFRDGPTLRFRASDVDELARSLGEMSDPSLQLAPVGLPTSLSDDTPESHEFIVADPPAPAPKPAEEPIVFGGEQEDLFLFPQAAEDAIPAAPPAGKTDSDVRLDSGPQKKGAIPLRADEDSILPTEEVAIDTGGPGSAIIRDGSTARLTGQKSSSKPTTSDSDKKIQASKLGDSSEFELSLDADSDDFELQLTGDDDEDALGGSPQGKRAGDSGINLRDPVDSGVNLERKKGPTSGKAPPPRPELEDSDSDLDFELSLDPPAGASSTKLNAPKTGKIPRLSDSDSEFELTLDDPSGGDGSLMHAAMEEDAGKNDIFETDFEIPPMEGGEESGSEAVAVEDADTDLESSDFDLALNDSDVAVDDDESASQVVVIDDEEPARPAARRKLSAADEDADVEVEAADVEAEEEEESAAGALAGVRGRSRTDEDEEEEDEEDAVAAGPGKPAPWGIFPLLFLVPCFLFMFGGLVMGYDLLHSMWGYHQPRKPAAPLVRGVADMFDMTVKDQ